MGMKSTRMVEGLMSESPDSIATGVAGLDDVLQGGFVADRLYLIEGMPGSGKTTLALQFLLEGARHGEAVLYLTLSETEEELRAIAASHGWSLDGITVREMLPAEATLEPSEQYTMFHPSDVELGQTMKTMIREVQRVKPARAVIDSLSELRLLAANSLRFRRQVLALKHFLAGRGCTVVLLDDLTAPDGDLLVQSIVHGDLLLEQMSPEYGRERRRLRVVKLRGRQYRGGYHDYVIQRGGIDVFPRLVLAEQRHAPLGEPIPTGVQKLDVLLGGGIERGTSTLIVGAPGTGKSTLATQLASMVASGGECAALFLFDEGKQTLLRRATGLGIGLQSQIDAGRVTVQSVDPGEVSPGEFAQTIRRAVEVRHAKIVVIDSLNGYLAAMPEERFLTVQLHELLTYLAQRGVASVLVGAHRGVIGPQMSSPGDASYLADTVILLRYFEARGEVRQAISIVKKRDGRHERTIREFRLDAGGIDVGEPLRRFRGVLTGVPAFDPDEAPGLSAEAPP
jgi:circadian clock protein KaiC